MGLHPGTWLVQKPRPSSAYPCSLPTGVPRRSQGCRCHRQGSLNSTAPGRPVWAGVPITSVPTCISPQCSPSPTPRDRAAQGTNQDVWKAAVPYCEHLGHYGLGGGGGKGRPSALLAYLRELAPGDLGGPVALDHNGAICPLGPLVIVLVAGVQAPLQDLLVELGVWEEKQSDLSASGLWGGGTLPRVPQDPRKHQAVWGPGRLPTSWQLLRPCGASSGSAVWNVASPGRADQPTRAL